MDRRPNVVWFLVDSIRNYSTDVDLRGKLPVMDRFAEESVEFTHCVTTAPSTIMSVTAMMTGIPAYCLARNYDEFRFDQRAFPCLAEILKDHGYSSHAFLRGPQTREKFRNLLDMVPRRLWPDGLRHSEKWGNADLNRLLDRVLEDGVRRPAFLFFHYNPQTRSEDGELLIDRQVSERVEQAWNRLENAGFHRENTIFVLCSDHGFPDPSTGMTSDWEKRQRLTHDLILTDDNILIPLYVGSPGMTPRRVDAPISSLDLFPTLLDLVNVPEAARIEARTDGKSLVPLMRTGKDESCRDRLFRTDSRLLLQTGRSTAIRGEQYKYIRYHDEQRISPSGELTSAPEVLIDLRKDPAEGTNLLTAEQPLTNEQNQALNQLRGEFERTESRAIEYQVEYLLTRQSETILKAVQEGTGLRRILMICEPETTGFEEIGLKTLHRLLGDAEVDLLTQRENPPTTDEEPAVASRKTRVFRYSMDPAGSEPLSGLEELGPRRYDLVVLFLEDPSDPGPAATSLLDTARALGRKHPIVLDCNFDSHRPSRYWYYRFRALLQSLPHIAQEPTLILKHTRTALKIVARRILKRFGRWERWEMPDEDASVDEG